MSSMLAKLAKPSITNEPPSPRDLRLVDIAVLATVIFALFLGLGIRNNALYSSREIALGEGLPVLAVPNNWITGEDDESVFYARNPSSPSTFDTEMRVQTRPLAEGETAATVRTALGVQRSQQLLRYREIAADRVTVDGEPGLLVTYAYIADPTRDQGALAAPVVVQAEDLIFTRGGSAIIVTLAADAADWDEEQVYFRLVQNSLAVRPDTSSPETLIEGAGIEGNSALDTLTGEGIQEQDATEDDIEEGEQ